MPRYDPDEMERVPISTLRALNRIRRESYCGSDIC